MAERSNDKPARVMTGQTMISAVMGQRKASGMSVAAADRERLLEEDDDDGDGMMMV